eukprot:CAMPEP_0168734830 /NCGR_PEP_ID=MMETSP0724-20121128/9019_1 /TAXON_ID=265536 /ORGANISM="Amphiprora sp., Strain CCMP467" /LENGTH=157 /DNA_ID=CAMNT_0008781953 /DNA_START=26 /DNA_END=499 /DNA_ORIENTATION=-
MATTTSSTPTTTPTTTTTTTTTALNAKRVVYVGGLAADANEPLVRAAFVPFGPLLSVQLPLDYVTGRHRGFGFVEFQDADDAAESVYNRDGAELLGRTLRVSLAQANQLHKLLHNGHGAAASAVWTSDEWFQQQNRTESETDGARQDAETIQQALQE